MRAIDPIAASAHGDALWFRRLDCPDAEEALRQYERVEASTPGDELLNAWYAGRRVRLVWLRIELPPDLDAASWSTRWVVVPRGTPESIECWEVV